MKRYSILVKLIGAILLLLALSTPCVVHAEQHEEDEVDIIEQETCSLNPSTNTGDCTTDETSTTSSPYSYILSSTEDLTRQVIPLTDETFDALTWTSQPSTWIIMFKTDSCGLCKKAKPVLESLAVHDHIINHNDDQMKQTNIVDGTAATAEETEKDDDQPPKGPIYVATIDAGSWVGRDITKRFEVDGTPHIILIRNEGYDGEMKEESRSYYVYRGQRALYPLRRFVLGEFVSRKQMEFPPPLAEEEQKKNGFVGRLYDLFLLPSVKWAGNIVKKILMAWFVFIGLLGLFMRVHNYAWGENADDGYNEEEEIEKEKAKGRAEFEEDKDEKTKRRQQIMWERKRANHEKRMQKKEGDNGDEDFQGAGSSVKKSDILKAKASSTKQKNR